MQSLGLQEQREGTDLGRAARRGSEAAEERSDRTWVRALPRARELFSAEWCRWGSRRSPDQEPKA